MKHLIVTISLLFGLVILVSSCKDGDESCVETTWYEDADGDGLGNLDVSQTSCDQPSGFVSDSSDTDDTGGTVFDGSTPLSAFDEFNPDAVTVSFDGDDIIIQSSGIPNHTSPYWSIDSSLYIEPVIANEAQMSPGLIGGRNYEVTLAASPERAATTSATGLGAIGIAVTGAPIFNEQEGPMASLSENVASGFDYAGGHMGPTGYHYHLEAADVEENTVLSQDDEKLVGILQDGFLLYGRKCNATNDYPTDLDESGGHTSSTQHSEGDEFYHYHIINEAYIGSYILLFGVDLQGTPTRIM
jgi:hypothetical protein